MFNKLLLSIVSFMFFFLELHAQENISLKYRGKSTIAFGYEAGGYEVGGLSGITYNANDRLYYVVADKPPARIFKVNINNDQAPEIKFYQSLVLGPELLRQSELEGIAYDHKNDKIFVADEQKRGTRIIDLDTKALFQRIFEPVNQAFLPLSGHNSGIEGLSISSDNKYLFYAFERPEDECLEKALVKVTKRKIIDADSSQVLYYKLHYVENDKLKSNGISEIIYLSKNSLLVMERAYIPEQGNIVRLYQVLIEDKNSTDKNVSCLDDSVLPLESQLLFDFASIDEFEIDNAEGMTFNSDRSILYIVTDNNFSRKQETQVVSLEVTWQ